MGTILEILDQTTTAIEPCKYAFLNPGFGNRTNLFFQSLGVIVSIVRLEAEAENFLDGLQGLPYTFYDAHGRRSGNHAVNS